MTHAASPRRDSDRRVVPWLLFGLVVLFGAAYVAAYLFTSDRIPRGTTVSGIRIGGLMPAAAEQRLHQGLDPRAAEPVTVDANGVRTTVVPTRSGLAYDVPSTVAAVGGGRSWDPVRMWDYVAGGHAQAPVVVVDQQALAAAVAEVADAADQPAVEGRVTFGSGEATPHYPENGTLVDRTRAEVALRAAFLAGERSLELPTLVDRPTISQAAVSRAMDSFANPAVSGPVVVRLDGEGVSVAPEEFADALSMRAQGAELVPGLDPQRLTAILAPKLQQITTPPRDAMVRIVDGRPRVVPARVGVGFDPRQVTARFLDVLRAIGDQRVLDVPTLTQQPHVTTAQAQAAAALLPEGAG